jgi:hypothetical protein
LSQAARRRLFRSIVPFFLIAKNIEGICAPRWNEAKIEVNPCKGQSDGTRLVKFSLMHRSRENFAFFALVCSSRVTGELRA